MVYNWIDDYNKYGIMGLMTEKGQGRKANLKKRGA
jgi:transposase